MNKEKGSRKSGAHTINPSFRHSPRFLNTPHLDTTLPNRLPSHSKNTPSDILFTKINRFKRGQNFKNMKKLTKIGHRRTATNSPKYNELSLAGCINDLKQNNIFAKPSSNMNMTMYGHIMNIPPKHMNTPSTSNQSQR